jgi:hypothetical protein
MRVQHALLDPPVPRPGAYSPGLPRTQTRHRLVLGLLDELRWCAPRVDPMFPPGHLLAAAHLPRPAHTHEPQRQRPSLGTRICIRAAIQDLTRRIIVCMRAHPCLAADASHRVCSELHVVVCDGRWTMDVRAEPPPPYVRTRHSGVVQDARPPLGVSASGGFFPSPPRCAHPASAAAYPDAGRHMNMYVHKSEYA